MYFQDILSLLHYLVHLIRSSKNTFLHASLLLASFEAAHQVIFQLLQGGFHHFDGFLQSLDLSGRVLITCKLLLSCHLLGHQVIRTLLKHIRNIKLAGLHNKLGLNWLTSNFFKYCVILSES